MDAVSPASRSKVDPSTTSLGLRLAHPFVAGASPLSADLDGARRLEDGGAAVRGSVSPKDVADPMLFERANYIRDLQTWGR